MDWKALGDILTASTERVFREFFERVPPDSLCAVGYVYEIGNASPQFSLCADTLENRRAKRERYPDYDASVRWNSGDFRYPAGLLGRDELGPEWAAAYAEVEAQFGRADDEVAFGAIYGPLMDTCASAWVALCSKGLFGDWTRLDFNVSETAEPRFVAQERHEWIVEKIRNHPGRR